MSNNIQFVIAGKYDDISPLFDGSYNPRKIGDTITREDFHEECIAAYDAIQKKLETLGECDSCGRRDFSTGRDWPKYHLSRKIGIVVHTQKMMIPSLISLILDTLRTFAESYIVTINGDIGPGRDFYITIEKNGSVTGYAKEANWLKPFGF